mgnify:CR=1 FL=1
MSDFLLIMKNELVITFIIFLLLYVVYHSAKEAAHVILAVPFALTGGVFLQYLLGYNFSVSVWVGYIALFGTAIQTGVVMVVYLEEMVAKKQAACAAAGTPFGISISTTTRPTRRRGSRLMCFSTRARASRSARTARCCSRAPRPPRRSPGAR